MMMMMGDDGAQWLHVILKALRKIVIVRHRMHAFRRIYIILEFMFKRSQRSLG